MEIQVWPKRMTSSTPFNIFRFTKLSFTKGIIWILQTALKLINLVGFIAFDHVSNTADVSPICLKFLNSTKLSYNCRITPMSKDIQNFTIMSSEGWIWNGGGTILLSMKIIIKHSNRTQGWFGQFLYFWPNPLSTKFAITLEERTYSQEIWTRNTKYNLFNKRMTITLPQQNFSVRVAFQNLLYLERPE